MAYSTRASSGTQEHQDLKQNDNDTRENNRIGQKELQKMKKEGLRNKKEFVNHKILDCIGDLYTSGYRIIGNVECSQGGHYLTNKLLRTLFENKENFSILEIKEKNLPHTLVKKSFLKSIA